MDGEWWWCLCSHYTAHELDVSMGCFPGTQTPPPNATSTVNQANPYRTNGFPPTVPANPYGINGPTPAVPVNPYGINGPAPAVPVNPNANYSNNPWGQQPVITNAYNLPIGANPYYLPAPIPVYQQLPPLMYEPEYYDDDHDRRHRRHRGSRRSHQVRWISIWIQLLFCLKRSREHQSDVDAYEQVIAVNGYRRSPVSSSDSDYHDGRKRSHRRHWNQNDFLFIIKWIEKKRRRRKSGKGEISFNVNLCIDYDALGFAPPPGCLLNFVSKSFRFRSCGWSLSW